MVTQYFILKIINDIKTRWVLLRRLFKSMDVRFRDKDIVTTTVLSVYTSLIEIELFIPSETSRL